MQEPQEQLEELMKQEAASDGFILKNSDQYFIQQNYLTMPLEQLSISTQLAPEVITQYIEEYESYLKANGICPDKKFNFKISINSEGNIFYGLEWPDLASVEKVLPYVGKFFYLLNAGELRNSIVKFLGGYAESSNNYGIVKKILTAWHEQEKLTKETPIVGANEVFSE